jgi:hypothetical protein
LIVGIKASCRVVLALTLSTVWLSPAGAGQAVRIENPGDASVRLAQYELTSISALERKLAQYPKGSSFTCDVTPLDPQTAHASWQS